METWRDGDRYGETERCFRSHCAICISCLLAHLLPSTFISGKSFFCRHFLCGGSAASATVQRNGVVWGQGWARQDRVRQELGGDASPSSPAFPWG